jgi:hypothetical protein
VIESILSHSRVKISLLKISLHAQWGREFILSQSRVVTTPLKISLHADGQIGFTQEHLLLLLSHLVPQEGQM